jgi:hypothetical protein
MLSFQLNPEFFLAQNFMKAKSRHFCKGPFTHAGECSTLISIRVLCRLLLRLWDTQVLSDKHSIS